MNSFGPTLLMVMIVGVPALFAIAVTAVPLLAIRRARAPRRWPYIHTVCGSAIPLAMLAYGLKQAWPWPWWLPNTMQDGFPPGPTLIFAALVAWPFCLLESRLLLGVER